LFLQTTATFLYDGGILVRFRQDQEIFSSCWKLLDWYWDSLNILYDGQQQLFSPGTKRPKCEADH